MLKQKVVLLALAVSLNGLHFAVAQSNTESAGPAHIIQMVNLVATVDKSIDTKKAKAGDPFDAKVATTVKLDDGTDVPSGSVLEGHVDSVTRSENKGDSVLTVTIDKLAIKDGKEIPIKATITQVASTASDSSDDRGYSDPSSYRVQNIPSTRPAGTQDPNAPKVPHSVPDLTLTSSVHDATSGTFTYAKKNLHMNNAFLLQVSVAVAHPGVKLQ
ncbi:MAG TPA: hypothetical protein VE178_14430 [Silvibacterium sp.]|nr:hypothetical protein [Silvibacterium sp.]